MNKFSYDLPKDLYRGMRIRPNMDTIANSIEKDTYRIKYPDRDATFYLNSPQFLSVLQDTNVGLAEQSRRLEKQKMSEAMARFDKRGGVVERALDTSYETASSGSDAMGMYSPRRLAQENLEARIRIAREEQEMAARQEADRIAQQQRDYEYAQFLRRQEEDAQRIQQEIARGSMGLVPLHPVASSAASASEPRYSESQLRAMAKSLIESQRQAQGGIDITFFSSPPERTLGMRGIVPRPMAPFGSTPFRLPADDMADAPPASLAEKRRSEDAILPIAKAKVIPGPTTPGPQIEEVVDEGSPKKSPKSVKKTGVKQVDELSQKSELKELLNNSRVYPIAEIRTKFKNAFPSIKSIISIERGSGNSKSVIIDKASREDIIAEYLHEITKKGRLAKELKDIRKETETRKAAWGVPDAAKYPPVGRGS